MPLRDLPPKNAGLKGADEARWSHYSLPTDREGGGKREQCREIGGREGRKKGNFILKRAWPFSSSLSLSMCPFLSHPVKKSCLIWVELFHVEEGDKQPGSIGLVSRNSSNSFATACLAQSGCEIVRERMEAGGRRGGGGTDGRHCVEMRIKVLILHRSF